eukprot:6072322-Pleurochrysis_carterae.AAC.2
MIHQHEGTHSFTARILFQRAQLLTFISLLHAGWTCIHHPVSAPPHSSGGLCRAPADLHLGGEHPAGVACATARGIARTFRASPVSTLPLARRRHSKHDSKQFSI